MAKWKVPAVALALAVVLMVAGAAFLSDRRQPVPGAPVTPPAPVAEVPSAGRELAPGDRAPDFTLPDANGKDFSLSQYTGKHNVLLFFHMGTG